MKNTLFNSTRKGLIIGKKRNGAWKLTESHFDSIPVTFSYEDPRNGNWWVALDHGHWGIKLHKSADKGKTWESIEAPAYPEDAEIKETQNSIFTVIWHH